MENQEKGKSSHGIHVLVLPFPAQGHINPIFNFSKRLVSKGLKVTLAITTFISKTMKPKSSTVQIETISDGYDEGGFAQANDVQAYLEGLEASGSKTLAELIKKYEGSDDPIDCVIYDAFLPWTLEVTKQLGLVGASFYTQSCAVNYICYYLQKGLLKLPVTSFPVSIDGLPLLEFRDMPSYIYDHETYPAYFKMILNQFLNVDKADYVLVSTFYELEDKVVDTMSKIFPLITIGPTIPSLYLDKQIENDKDSDLNLFPVDSSSDCTNWLSTKPKGSVVYVSFGSMANLSDDQMEELAWGLKRTEYYFLWVVRDSEEKIPKELKEEISEKGFLVKWSPQMEVLSDEAVGCFFTHCGWNSTIEALCLGVPMVAMPQLSDQTTNAKFVQDVWKVGIRVKADEKGIVGREEIEGCVRDVMEGEKREEMKKNAMKWKDLAKAAVSEGGSSDLNINKFLNQLKISKYGC